MNFKEKEGPNAGKLFDCLDYEMSSMKRLSITLSFLPVFSSCIGTFAEKNSEREEKSYTLREHF